VYANAFRVIEAPSRLAVAAYMRQHPHRWNDCLRRSGWWEAVRDGQWSAEERLTRIDATWVDGNSRYQMFIHAITTIEPCEPGNDRRGQGGQR
jgi:hypothetical protein